MAGIVSLIAAAVAMMLSISGDLRPALVLTLFFSGAVAGISLVTLIRSIRSGRDREKN